MFEIYPVSYASIRPSLLGLEKEHQAIWNEVVNHGETIPTEKPFIQLGYDEITKEDMDRALGYKDIVRANGPIGLPYEFDAFTWQRAAGQALFLFPLSGLHLHFREVVPDVYNDYEACGSMIAFEQSRGERMTALDYMVGGCIECIAFCKINRSALMVRW